MQELMKTRKVEWNYVLRMCNQHHCYFGSFYTWSNIFLCLRGTFLSRLFLSFCFADRFEAKQVWDNKKTGIICKTCKMITEYSPMHDDETNVICRWPFQVFAILRIATLQFGKLVIYFNFDRQGFKSSVTRLWSWMQCHTFSRGPEVSWALQNSASASLLYT